MNLSNRIKMPTLFLKKVFRVSGSRWSETPIVEL